MDNFNTKLYSLQKMTTEFKTLQVKKYPVAVAISKGDAGYWKKFNVSLNVLTLNFSLIVF